MKIPWRLTPRAGYETSCRASAVALHPQLPSDLLARMVALLQDLHEAVNVRRQFGGAGGPWEFNLRDLLRWCCLVEASTAS